MKHPCEGCPQRPVGVQCPLAFKCFKFQKSQIQLNLMREMKRREREKYHFFKSVKYNGILNRMERRKLSRLKGSEWK